MQVARYLPVMTDLSPKRHDKFRAYRAKKKAAGLREVRLWLPDVRSPEFQASSARESAALRASFSEEESMRWIEALCEEQPGMFD